MQISEFKEKGACVCMSSTVKNEQDREGDGKEKGPPLPSAEPMQEYKYRSMCHVSKYLKSEICFILLPW